MIVDFVRLSF